MTTDDRYTASIGASNRSTEVRARDLYEILEERSGRRSTILTSQIPFDKWHQVIHADAILDRLVHNAHRIDLAGDSLRRTRSRPALKD